MDQEVTEQEAVQTDAGGMEDQTVQQEPEGGEPDKSDYFARIRSDPEFAVDLVRQRDRQLNEKNQVLKKVEGLDRFVDAAGGVDNLISLVNTGYTISTNEQLKGFVEDFVRTGRLPSAQEADGADDGEDDPYMDPDMKDLKAENRRLTDRLEELTRTIDQRFAQADVRGLQGSIEKNITSIIDRYGKTDPLREAISKEINSRVEEAQKLVHDGMDSMGTARNFLEMIGDAKKGEATLRKVIADVILDEENLLAYAAAHETRKAKSVAQQSTGAPSAARTAGGEQPLAVEYGPGFVRQALEKATRDAGRDPNRLWGNS